MVDLFSSWLKNTHVGRKGGARGKPWNFKGTSLKKIGRLCDIWPVEAEMYKHSSMLAFGLAVGAFG